MVVGKLAMLVYAPLISVSKCLNNEKKKPCYQGDGYQVQEVRNSQIVCIVSDSCKSACVRIHQQAHQFGQYSQYITSK